MELSRNEVRRSTLGGHVLAIPSCEQMRHIDRRRAMFAQLSACPSALSTFSARATDAQQPR